MPLTLYCYGLKLLVTKVIGTKPYASRALKIEGDYTLTELGRLKLEFMKLMDSKYESESLFERTTAGTIALWFLRRQERIRQLQGIKERSKDPDWQTLRKHYKTFLPVVVPIYKQFFIKAQTYLKEVEKDRDWDRIRLNISNYIRDQKKSQTSTVSNVYDRLPYKLVLDQVNIPLLIRYYIRFLQLIIDNFYSKKRVNPRFILSAIRNRPLDLFSFTNNHLVGSVDRSREANGQPPESIIYMLIYEIKEQLIHEAVSAFEQVYGLEIIDPIRDRDFYFKYTQRKDGLYMFGDNGALIKNGQIVGIYDLSISDIFQAWMRNNDGNNFCIFLRLGEGYDSGSTGDCLTTLWTLEGQMFIWWCYNQGYLSSKDEIPWIPELVGETRGFLGHYYDDDLQDYYASGIKLTRDSIRKAIPLTLNRFGPTELLWRPRENVKANEILALLITSGVGDIGLTKFYEWVKKNRLTEGKEEIYSITERVEALGMGPDFLDLTDMDLSKLAYPYAIEG
jgi:hypothetical protein